MQMPNWMASDTAPAPDYNALLAQAKMKMLGLSSGMGPRPQQPSPASWADAGLMGAGQQQDAGGDRSRSIDDLPPELRRVFDRMSPDMQDRLLSIWQERGGGFRSMERAGGRDATGPQFGNQGPGGMTPDPAATMGRSASATGPIGPGWSKGTAMVGALTNPVLGLALEGGRRGYNTNQANEIRGMLDIDNPRWWGDMFGDVGKGSRTASLGTVDIGNGPTHVSWGGMYGDGRTAYTPEEARRRKAAQNYGGYRGGSEGGGGRSTAGVGEGGWGSEADRTSNPGGMGGY